MVPTAQWRGQLPAHGGDVDDGARALGAHVRGDQLGEATQAEDVDLELTAGLVDRDVLDGPVGAVAGVVDQDVDAAGLLQDAVHAGGHRGVVGHVHGQRADTVGGQGLEAVGAAGRTVDDVAQRLEFASSVLADAGGGAGDECGAGRTVVCRPGRRALDCGGLVGRGGGHRLRCPLGNMNCRSGIIMNMDSCLCK